MPNQSNYISSKYEASKLKLIISFIRNQENSLDVFRYQDFQAFLLKIIISKKMIKILIFIVPK
ncbi:hypothetical protein Cal7507_1368 [Calothrix sp. PCC 7507]|nr:hypothetical protein Cal7507_1368 [Calothrix sp. PCC 7507]